MSWPFQPEAPALPDPADLERSRLLAAGDDLILRNYRAVVKAIVEGAKGPTPNRTCQELFLKLVAPIREEHVQHLEHKHGPEPLSIRIGLFQMHQRILPGVKSVVEISDSEWSALPDSQRAELLPYRVPLLSAESQTAQLSGDRVQSTDGPTVPADSHEPNNCICSDCSQGFFSRQPWRAKYCPECKAERARLHLEEHHAKRAAAKLSKGAQP